MNTGFGAGQKKCLQMKATPVEYQVLQDKLIFC